MPILKFVNEDYSNPGAFGRVCNYIFSANKTPYRLIGGVGVVVEDFEYEMLMVKKAYDKMGGRQLRHFIVSFSDSECIMAHGAYQLGFQIAQYYGDKYQIVFAVHQDEPQIHIHFLFNTVSYVNGFMYAEGNSDYWKLSHHINTLMKSYV